MTDDVVVEEGPFSFPLREREEAVDSVLWPPPNSTSFRILICDHWVVDPTVETAEYYPITYDSAVGDPVDDIEIPAYLDILTDMVGDFSVLEDVEEAKLGRYTEDFQFSLLVLAWRTVKLPNGRDYAGAMGLVCKILMAANPEAEGLVATMRDEDGVELQEVTAVQRRSATVLRLH